MNEILRFNLRAFRERNNYTQQELAKMLGQNQGMVSYYERNWRSVKKSTILQIAKTLGVDPLELYTDGNGVSAKDMDEYYKKRLKACVNELCILCGKYQHEHEGACDGCTWIKDKYDEE